MLPPTRSDSSTLASGNRRGQPCRLPYPTIVYLDTRQDSMVRQAYSAVTTGLKFLSNTIHNVVSVCLLKSISLAGQSDASPSVSRRSPPITQWHSLVTRPDGVETRLLRRDAPGLPPKLEDMLITLKAVHSGIGFISLRLRTGRPARHHWARPRRR